MEVLRIAALTVFGITSAAAVASAGTLVQWNFNSQTPDGSATTGSLVPSTNLTFGTPTIGGIGLGTSTNPAPTAVDVAFVGATTSSTISTPLDNSSDPASSDNSGLLTRNYPDKTVGSDTAGIIISLSTSGYQGLTLTWDQKTDSAASRYYRVRYSTDGQNFTSVGQLYEPTSTNFWDANHPYNGGSGTPAGSNYSQWVNGISRDLSGVTALNEQALIYLEIVSEFDPATGTQYLDNHSPAKTPVYAPTNASVRFDQITISASPTPEPSALCLIGFSTILFYRHRATGK